MEEELKSDAKPVVHSARCVPFRLQSQFKAQLEEMEENQLITKVTEPTEWVNPLVTVMKSGQSLRICLDPGLLNAAIKREHFAIPTAEEIFAKLHSSRYFRTLDTTSGFMQTALDEESSYLTTFATPFGRYRYRRLPYGISSAPEVFHKRIADMFGDIKEVETFIDDILIHALTEEQHDDRLRRVLDRCLEVGLKMNREKCNIKCTEVKYLGHIISAEGLQPDPTKVDVIQNMLTLKCKEDVRRTLGMVTYLAKFCPNLSQESAVLRDLTCKDVDWF